MRVFVCACACVRLAGTLEVQEMEACKALIIDTRDSQHLHEMLTSKIQLYCSEFYLRLQNPLSALSARVLHPEYRGRSTRKRQMRSSWSSSSSRKYWPAVQNMLQSYLYILIASKCLKVNCANHATIMSALNAYLFFDNLHLRYIAQKAEEESECSKKPCRGVFQRQSCGRRNAR